MTTDIDTRIRYWTEVAASFGFYEEHWFYLSFVDDRRPRGDQFIGGVYLRAPALEAAPARAHMLGLNPGGEVMMAGPLPAELIKENVPPEHLERLLTREQVEGKDGGVLVDASNIPTMPDAPESTPGNRLFWDVDYGFTIIADEDVADSYEFDQVAVVKAPDGTLWAAHDSGCSCPSPFEDHTWPVDWTPIRQLADIEPLLREWSRDDGTAAARIRDKVKEALK